MYIKIEPAIDTESILKQLEKIKKMAIELEEETTKLKNSLMWPKFQEKEDSIEPSIKAKVH